MNDLITMIDGNAVLDPVTADLIATYEKKVKEIKEQEDKLRTAILEAMEQNNVIKLKTDKITISYIAPTDKEYFDKKKFQSEHADLYDEYVTMKPQDASIRITLAKGK